LAHATDPPDVNTPDAKNINTEKTTTAELPAVSAPPDYSAAAMSDKLVCPDGSIVKKESWEDLGNSESCYKDDKKEGPSNIFTNNKLYSKENYRHGKLEGETVIFEDSGKKTKLYKSGNLISEIVWYLNNNKKIETTYGKDPKKPTVHYYHEDGTEASSNPDSETAYWINKVPEDARKFLDVNNQGWHLLGFTINRPPVLIGDLNGDGKPDYIVLLKVGKISKAVALLVSDKGFSAFDIVELHDETASSATVVHNAKNDNIRFSGDKTGITYEFNGKGFSKLNE
jgi:antitoxin component YwqK of YwqJK toxin-antitoxin module